MAGLNLNQSYQLLKRLRKLKKEGNFNSFDKIAIIKT